MVRRVVAGTIALLLCSTGYVVYTATQSHFALTPLYVTHDSFPGNLSSRFDPNALDSISLEPDDQGTYTLAFLRDGSARFTLTEVDLGLFLPSWRAPSYYSGITDITVASQEFHRVDLEFWDAESDLIVSLANNCLSGGYWEVAIREYDVSGYEVDMYHGSFRIPPARYVRLLTEHNGWPSLDALVSLWSPSEVSATAIHLPDCRHVLSESMVNVKDVDWHLDEPPQVFMEQGRKRKLTVAPPKHFADVIDPRGVIFTAFVPPGSYDTDERTTRDYSYLAGPTAITMRNVKAHDHNHNAIEIEIVLANGWSLVATGISLDAFSNPVLGERLDPTSFVKVGFGLNTRTSRGWYEDRRKEQGEFGTTMVMVRDAHGYVLGNHLLGLEELWLELVDGRIPALEMYVFGFEREIVVAHWTIPVPEGFLTVAQSGVPDNVSPRVYLQSDMKHARVPDAL